MAEAEKADKKEGVLKRIAKATGSELGERGKGVLAQSFPLLTAAPYIRGIQSLPGAGITSAILKKADLFGDKKTKKEEDLEKYPLEQESFSVLEKILEQVVEIRKIIVGPILKKGFIFEPPKGRGKGGFKSLITGRYVKEEEAVAEEKPSISSTMRKKTKGAIGTGKDVYKAAKTVTKGGIGEIASAGVARVGGMAAGAGTAAIGVAAGGLKLTAILAALAMFLPKDLKSVIGSIFEGLLQGLGFDKDTIEAIFVPFQILSDIAELIKKIIGLAWDGVKWLFGMLGSIMDWFTSRSKVSASEEVSRATGGTGHGEFTTGGEAPAEAVPIPPSEPPPPKQTGAEQAQPARTGTAAPAYGTPAQPARTGVAVATPAPAAAPPVATAVAPPVPAPAATPAATPPAAPAPIAVKAEPVPKFPQMTDEEAVKIHEWFNKPENATINMQYEQLYNRSATIKKAIASTQALIRSETDPEKIKEHKRILKEELEPGLERTEKQRKDILGMAREAVRAGGGADALPATPPPAPTPSMDTGAGTSSGSGAGETAAASAGGGGGDTALPSESSAPSPSPAAELQPQEPMTGQQIDQESMNVEYARDEMPSNVTSEVIENGEVAAGSVFEDKSKVPSPVAPREDLDVDIFFSALA